MMKTIRTLLAVPFLLLGLTAFLATIFEFGKALITMSLPDVVFGFAALVLTGILTAIGGALNPNRKTTTKPEPQSMSTNNVRVVIIPADATKRVTFTSIDDSLRSQQAVVGGYVEAVGRGLDWVAYADEEGKTTQKPYNQRATHAMTFMAGHNPGDPIVGDVLVTGVDKNGVTVNIPNSIAGKVLDFAGEVTA
jgi:hypothetical protein